MVLFIRLHIIITYIYSITVRTLFFYSLNVLFKKSVCVCVFFMLQYFAKATLVLVM